MTRLSTGKRINAGKDDPAGLISSERLAMELKALEAESRGLSRQDANANITDGHMSQLSTMMSELNGLVVSSANTAGMSDAEIEANQMQIDSLASSIRRFSSDAVSSLGGIDIADGGNADVAALLNGADAAVNSLVSGGSNSLASGNFEAAQAAIEGAISDVATARGTVGAYQRNTIQPRVNSIQVAFENLTASKSRIMDADYAVETSNRIRFNLLTTSTMKVLKIAQQQSQSVLALLS